MTAPDDTALAERLWRAWRDPRDPGMPTTTTWDELAEWAREGWLRVAVEARAAAAVLAVRLATEGDAMRNIAIAALAGKTDPSRALRAILAVPRVCRTCGRCVEPLRRCFAIPTCYTCLPPPSAMAEAMLPPDAGHEHGDEWGNLVGSVVFSPPGTKVPR